MAQGVDVSLQLDIQLGAGDTRKDVHKHSHGSGSPNAVVWLTPLAGPAVRPQPASRSYELIQKDKQFTPHLLVIPTGSFVDFPNLDPFFHNVFSLYNGKRFDLGLYEAHTHRAVRFDRDGVSYIFCNIHPQMGAVIVSLSTPFYAIPQPSGLVIVRDVPSGSYRLHIWAENVPAEQLASAERTVVVGSIHAQVGLVQLHSSGDIIGHHDNKFGKEYSKDVTILY